MLRFIPLLILAGIVAEIASIIWVGRAIGLLPTLLLLFGGVVIGLRLIRSAGTSVAEALRSPIQTARPMQGFGGKAIARVIAGLLFLVPGFFSDALGILVLLPPLQRWLRSRFRVETFSAASTRPQEPFHDPRFGTVIEAEAIEIIAESEAPASPGNKRL